ncbi:hypothetical protein RI367_001982 [Sorochytrium milnesiophthora]
MPGSRYSTSSYSSSKRGGDKRPPLPPPDHRQPGKPTHPGKGKLNALVTEGDFASGFYAARELLKSRRFAKVTVAVANKDAEFSRTLAQEGATVIQYNTLVQSEIDQAFKEADPSVLLLVPPPMPDMVLRVNNILKSARNNADLTALLLWSKLGAQYAGDVPDDEHDGKPERNIIVLYQEVEELVKRCGIDAGIIRVGFTLQTLFLMSNMIQSRGLVALPSDSAKFAPVNYHDIGRASVNILATGKLPGDINGQTLTFTGPELVTGPEMVDRANKGMNTDIKFEQVSLDEMRAILSQTPLPLLQLDGVIATLRLFEDGKLDVETDDLNKALHGKKPSTIESFFEKNHDAFSPNRPSRLVKAIKSDM